jgi:hypothetical protein
VNDKTWTLHIAECPDGRLAVTGLPADRGERLSLVMRLRDVLAAVVHADDVDHEGDGMLWQRYCRATWPAWQEHVTVERIRSRRRVSAP